MIVQFYFDVKYGKAGTKKASQTPTSDLPYKR
jgi:hypothetical protein